MKNCILFLLLFSFISSIAQPTRTKDQTDRLNAKNGFRKYILGTPLSYHTNRIEKQIEDAGIHSKLYKFKNEELTISGGIKAEWIIFQFTVEKLDEISIKLNTGSKDFFDFLFREYGDPDVKPADMQSKILFYEWKGRQSRLQYYFTEGKEGATFKITTNEPKDKDTEIRQGF